MWYRDNEPEMFSRVRKIIGSKDYINLRLTGRSPPTSPTPRAAASTTCWTGATRSSSRASGLPREIFPEIVPSTQILGTLRREAAAELGLPASVQVACGGVDNSCMALGARNTGEGRVYTSLGSSSWIAVSSAEAGAGLQDKPYVFTHVVPELFTSAVSIFSGGNSFRWIRDNRASAGRDPYEVMTELAATSPVGANKLLFNPSLAGGARRRPARTSAAASPGIDLRHTRADLVRAGMEGIAMNLGAVLAVLRRFVPLGEEMLMVGGGSRSPLWRQIFADVYGMDIVKTNIDQEAASLGAAAVAAVGCGLWKDFAPVDDAHQVASVENPSRPTPRCTAG